VIFETWGEALFAWSGLPLGIWIGWLIWGRKPK
jgi:hypothetical protein